MDQRYQHNYGAHYSLKYHIVFCPKYRKPVLTGAIEARFKELVSEKIKSLGGTIEAMEVMPDHVHIFLSIDPTEAPCRIVNQIKGYTSRFMMKEFKNILKLPTLWSRSYYIGTIGSVSEEVVKNYIENQKGK
jgi:putative transposase